MAERFLALKSGDSRTQRKFGKPKKTEKSTSTWLHVWTSWAENKNFKTKLLAYEAKQLDGNKHMALDD